MSAATQTPIYLNAISHNCGSWLPIEEMPQVDNFDIAVAQLKKLGIYRYSLLKKSLRDLVVEGVTETINKGAIDNKDIDATIFFSTTFDTYQQHSDVAQALDALGLEGATPYGVFHNQCTNHTQALQLAQMLCATGRANNILIFGYDALDDSRSPRMLENRTSVYSDVFVSLLVSAKPIENSFRVDLIHHHYCPEVLRYQNQRQALQFITKYSESFKKVCDHSYNLLSMTPRDFKLLITPNYNFSVVSNLAELAGMPRDRVFLDNISRYSHCFSADHFISLQTLCDNGLVENSDQYFLTAVGGFVVYSAMVLTRV